MPCNLKAFGLERFDESPKTIQALLDEAERLGMPREGYEGKYLCYDHGQAELILRLARDKENPRQLNFCGLDTQLIGDTTWTVTLVSSAPDPEAEEGAGLMRQCVVQNALGEGKGFALIDVVTADIRPTYTEGTRLELQVCALPYDVAYYADEEAYVADAATHLPLPKGVPREDGKDYAVFAQGSVWPLGLLSKDESTPKDLTYVRGEVVSVRKGRLADRQDAFWIVTIDTSFGPLDVVHGLDAVREEQRPFIRRGAILAATCVLSADATTVTYDGGRVDDEDNLLLLVGGVLARESPDRLRAVATPGLRYVSEYNKSVIEGLDAVIERIRSLQASARLPDYRFRLATVVGVRQPAGLPRLPHGVGTRCAYLYHLDRNGREVYLGLLFLTLDGQNRVTTFEISQSDAYALAYDKPRQDVDTPQHVWPKALPPATAPFIQDLNAFAKRLVEEAARQADAEGKGTAGGLVWLKDEWEAPVDFAHLLFAYNGVPYALYADFVCWPELGSCDVPGRFSRRVPNEWKEAGATTLFILLGIDAKGQIRSLIDDAHGGPIRDVHLNPYGLGDHADDAPMGALERKRLAIAEARAFLARNGLECLSVCGYPEAGPEIWFRDAQGRPCWLRVHLALTQEETDAKPFRDLERALPRLRANDGYFLAVHLPGFGAPRRGARPRLVCEPFQRLCLAP